MEVKLKFWHQVEGNFFIHLTSWDELERFNTCRSLHAYHSRDPYNTITIDGTDDFESDEDTRSGFFHVVHDLGFN